MKKTIKKFLKGIKKAKKKQETVSVCSDCKGTGRFPHAEITCAKCDGSGK